MGTTHAERAPVGPRQPRGGFPMSNAEVSAEYCRRAFVARNLAMSASCPDTKAYLLELEQLWLSQARRHEPSNCCARIG
jgi:hypothetical protein